MTELTRADWARSYRERGWSPIPLKFEDKAPLHNNWQRLQYSPEQIPNVFIDTVNIGLILGSPSGNILDLDLDDAAAVMLAPYFLTETGTVFGRPGKPNSHFLYTVDESETLRRQTFFDPDGTLLLEIRGEGHQTMVPSSVHPTGEQLEWAVFDQPARTTVEKLEIRAGYVAAAAMMGRHWPEWESRRHAVVLALAGGLMRAGLTVETVTEFIKAVCLVGRDTDWIDREKAIQSTADAMAEAKEVTGFPKLAEFIGSAFVTKLFEWLKLTTAKDRIPDTDHGNALRFASTFQGELLYVPEWKEWLIWDSNRWKIDKAERVYGFARELPAKILEEATKEGDEAVRNRLLAWHKRSQDVSRLNAVLRIARTDEAFLTEADRMDADPWLFNVPNGTLNLRTGGLQAHDPRDRITKMSPIPYDPDATAPLWREYLNTIHKGNQGLIDFLQKLVGYSMTGLTTEQVFVLMWGLPGTGKSTFIETLRRVFGDYATNAEPEVFMAKNSNSRANPEVARLQGARLVTSSETEENKKLAIARVKLMTGGDRVTAANLYAAPFEFEPIMKLWISTNHKPRVPADEGGIWDRMVLVPFEVDMRNSPDRVFDLKDQLARELPGILAWAVEGCQKWQLEGLGRPPEVLDAQSEYREESDELADFLEEMTENGPDFRVKSSVLFAAYKDWAQRSGFHHPFNVKRFKEKMLARGFELKAYKDGNYWMGIQIPPRDVNADEIDLSGGRPNPFGAPRNRA